MYVHHVFSSTFGGQKRALDHSIMDGCEPTVGVLGTKPGSSIRATSALEGRSSDWLVIDSWKHYPDG